MFVDEAQKNSPVRENRGITHQRPHQRQRRPIVLIDPILLMSKHTLRHAPRQYDHIMIGRGLAHPPVGSGISISRGESSGRYSTIRRLFDLVAVERSASNSVLEREDARPRPPPISVASMHAWTRAYEARKVVAKPGVQEIEGGSEQSGCGSPKVSGPMTRGARGFRPCFWRTTP